MSLTDILESEYLEEYPKTIKFNTISITKLQKLIELDDIVAIHSRVEDLAHNSDYREKFDYSTARAVASLPVLSEYCLPFVKVGGQFIAYKSEKASEELDNSSKALAILKGDIEASKDFLLPNTDLKRSIIFIK